jgi:toxin YoeB
MNDVIFHAKAFTEYMEWQVEDRKTLKKINELIKDMRAVQKLQFLNSFR